MTSPSPPNPFNTSPSPQISPPTSPTPSQTYQHPRASSLLSAASGSPPPTHRASFPNPSSTGKKGGGMGDRLTGPKMKDGFCCERDKEISGGGEVSIIDALKTSEGGKGSYITYVIRLGSNTTRRRYSSFLTLHQALTSLYPVLIIPPIPSKQSLTDYAVKGQSKAKEDATVIARRKRLLEDFLRRLCRHPILGQEHVLHRFLEDGVSWSEVLHSPPISLLPKNPLHAPSHNPTFQPSSPSTPTASLPPLSTTNLSSDPTCPQSPSPTYIAHHLLPTPSASHPLHNPDQRFLDSEAFTEKFQNHLNGVMEKVNRRVTRRWGERAGDMSELGAVWNGFSLVEGGKVGEAVEKVGQAVDAEYMATAALLQRWEITTTEPLHIYAQFAAQIRSRLSFRHQKHVQYELVQEALETQKDKLAILEAQEKEARRLDEALERGGRGLGGGSTLLSGSGAGEGDGGDRFETDREREREREAERERLARVKRGTGIGAGLLSAVKHSLSGMMDVDPEATRRANIGKTRDNISQLEDSLQASAQDLKYASTTLQADLDRFQRQKVADLRELTIQLSIVHRDWCKANLDAWKAAREAINQIESHPNQLPPSAHPTQIATLEISSPSSPRAQQYPQPSRRETSDSPSGGAGTGYNLLGIRNEIDRVEAANIPLPLAENDNGGAGVGVKGKGKSLGDDPLGPL